MTKSRWTWATVAAAVLLAFLAIYVPTPQGEAKAAPAEAVVKVVLTNGHGSGVHIGDGYIVTAAHVVGDQEKVKIKSTLGGEQEAEVLWINKSRDIAMLKVADASAYAAALLECKDPAVGDPVVAKGNPLSSEFVSFWGHISGTGRTDGPWRNVFVVDISGAPGISGGPVYNTAGNVIGIFVGAKLAVIGGMYPSFTGISLVVPGSSICEMLARA